MSCGLAGEALRGVTIQEAEIATMDLEWMKEQYYSKSGEEALEHNQYMQSLFAYLNG